MRVFELTSTKTDTVLVLTYDTQGLLCGVSPKGDFTSAGFEYVIRNMGAVDSLILISVELGYDVAEVDIPAPTFPEFWKKYGLRKDKKKAEAIWNRMKEDGRIKAFKYIEKYKNDLIKTNFAQKMAKTYLLSECWDDEN